MNVIISVAHALYRVPVYELGVVLGQNYQDRGTTIHTVLFVVIHNEFDPYILRNDIALLRFNNDKTYRENVKTVPILNTMGDLNNRMGLVTGWGRCDWKNDELCLPRSNVYYPHEIIDTMLRTATFEIVDPQPYCEGYMTNGLTLYPGMYCIGPAREDSPLTSCLGSPGSPLVVNGKLVGVASWGFACCYPTDLPIIYSDVRFYSKWLKSNLAVLVNIPNDELTDLYKATKAFSLAELTFPMLFDSFNLYYHNDLPMELKPFDYKLTLLDGKVYDFRDFYRGRIYHPEKKDLYEMVRKKISRTEIPNKVTTTSDPFEEIGEEYADDEYAIMYRHNEDDLPND